MTKAEGVALSLEKYAACRIRLEKGGSAGWATLLQEGFQAVAVSGESVRDFLLRELELEGEYVDICVRTIFLNGKPVDDIDAALVSDGDVMSLSAALPGAAGICMRRDSPYAALRGDITFGREKLDGAGKRDGRRGLIELKLFNQILTDLGPRFLERGVVIPWKRLRARLGEWSRLAPEAGVYFDEKPTPLAALASREEAVPGEKVFFRIDAA